MSENAVLFKMLNNVVMNLFPIICQVNTLLFAINLLPKIQSARYFILVINF